MAFKVSTFNMLHGFLARRVLLRILMIVTAVAMLPFLKFVSDVDMAELFAANASNCTSNMDLFQGRFLKLIPFHVVPLLDSQMSCDEKVNVTSDVFRELLDMKLLGPCAKALSVGEGSAAAVSVLQGMGISDVSMVKRHPFSFMGRKRFASNLPFGDNSFDFVFSRELDTALIPALPVLEIERVLKPGGVGAMLVGVASSSPGSLILTATPISLFLKSSDVVHVRGFNSFALVVFKKRCSDFCSFDHYRLPNDCSSITNNKPFIKHLEPLVREKLMGTNERFSYLPKFLNISNRNQLIYIDVGVGEFANSSIANWFLPFYPAQSRAFDIYAVDHNSSHLSSYVGNTGITFVYYPGLSENWATADLDTVPQLGPSPNDAPEGFDFLGWFKRTVGKGTFVVLKMDAGGVGLKLLHELFESGAICLVDELFLRCTNSTDGQVATGGDCSSLFKALRSSGVFVHQW
ncbi:uncharacterized protein LOC131245986 [Magnolia sinica]|uniref:uncharacterized protein LOC131245986 n=1 Tax=Magnolia sinica TaxID=86752 RepID=UPI00265B5149|nr:uncharacterized protein LOC131245986 [Magnolia sinica]